MPIKNPLGQPPPLEHGPQDIFDNPTPFHTGKHVFDDDADTGDEMIEELVPNAQLLPARLFWGCWVRTPAGS